MSSHRSFKALLAAAILTTGLIGCADLNGPGVGKDTLDTVVEKPGEQLLSNGAATAISNVMAGMREVGSLKNMASQDLLSNSSGNLLSNGMGGYRIASTGTLKPEDYDRIVWDDQRQQESDGSYSGTIIGKLDGTQVEHYTYTFTVSGDSLDGGEVYLRTEIVHASAFREKGTYALSSTTAITSFDPETGFGEIETSGASTFDPDGLKRKSDFTMYILAHTADGVSFDFYDVDTTVKGALPSGSVIDAAMAYEKNAAGTIWTLASSGSLTTADASVKYKSKATKEQGKDLAGSFQLGLAKDFWLSFDFNGYSALSAIVRDDAGASVKELTYTEDKKKVIINPPGEEKPEHLALDVVPQLYLKLLGSALPPVSAP